ncbi:MAG: hypothetical protein EBU90_25010, partial [Proteobacteria bacterium]|nr:hypothetical protein [Pseudomonadota bacterium]
MNKIEQAVAPLKNDAIKRAEEKGQAMIANHLENLEKAGWDLNVVAPRPHTMMDRKSYKEKMALHNMIRQLTSSNTPTRRINDPDIRIRNRQAEQRLLDQIKQDAAFEYDKFAPNAKVHIVDIDEIEHSKNTRASMSFVASDAFAFLESLIASSSGKPMSKHKLWLHKCSQMKHLLPVQEQFSPEGSVSIYDVVRNICENFGSNDVLVSDAGSAYYVASIMFSKKDNQRYVTSGAQADMGFSLPAAIGVAASFGSSSRRVHAVTGDGSFQLNIQEIQTLVTNRL